MRRLSLKTRLNPIAAVLAAAFGLNAAEAANVSWIGANGSFWDLATNWNPGLPTAADDVLLGAFNTEVRSTSGTVTVNSYSGTGQLRVNGGVLLNNANSSIGSLQLAQGGLGGTGNLTITGVADITFGDMRGTGTTFLQGASSISSSGMRLDGGRVLANQNTLTWSGGQILFNNTFNGASAGVGSGTINNQAGAQFIVSGNNANTISASNQGVGDTGADAVFNNAGTFRKSGSNNVSVTNVDVLFNNTGVVDVQTGVLNLGNGGTHSGSFIGAGTIGFTGGTHVLGATSSLTAANASFSGSNTTTVNGTYNVSGSTTVGNGTLTINGPLTSLGGTLTINGGTLNLGAANTSVNTLVQSSGSLTGTGTFTVTGPATLTFGDHRGSGTTVLQGASTISSSGFRLDGGRVLANQNTLTWSGGQILFNNTFNGASGGVGSGTINNQSGALFVISGDSAGSMSVSNQGVGDTGADAVFNNAGTLRKSGSTNGNATTIDVLFNNTGTVDVQTGVLNLSNGGTHSGSFTGAGTIAFAGGTHVLGATSSLTAANVNFSGSSNTTVNGTYNVSGSTTVSSGNVTINGPLTSLGTALTISSGTINLGAANATVSTLTQSSGSLSGTGTLTVTGVSNLTFGDHRGTGTTVLQGATSIGSSGFRLDGGRVVNNQNTLTWTAGTILFNNTFNGASAGAGSGTINNQAGATFIASGNTASTMSASNFGVTDTGADAVFNNAGTFRKAGSGTTDLTTVDVAFNNSGTVDVQTGVLNLGNGGTHSGGFIGAGTIGFAGGTHVLSAASSLTGANVSFSGSGTTTINGTYNVSGSTSVSGNAVVNVNGTLTSLGTALNVSGGTLNLGAANATVTTLTQSSGSVGGTGTLTVSGPSTITFGDHRGTGTTVLQGATAISSSGLRLDGGRVLNNQGTVTWSAGSILFNNTFNGTSGGPGSGTINNQAGATFIASGTSPNSISASNFGATDTGADAVFNNAGTFRKSGSGATDTTTVDVQFNNTGSVQAQTGILNLSNGGTHTGGFDVSAGAVLAFGGGTHNVNGGSVTSPGTLRVAGSSTVNVNIPYSIAGTTEVQSGFLNLLGGNASTGALVQSNGSISGSGVFTVAGPSTITFGDHRGSGTTVLQGATTISSSGFRLDGGRTLNNQNTVTWTAGQILFNNTFNGTNGGAGSGTINNQAGATFIASGSGAVTMAASNFGGTDTGADAVFNNAGTFRKAGSGATDTTTVDVQFNNTGSVQAQTGILSLSNGGTHTGGFDVSAGAVLAFGGGTHNINGGSVTSPGTVRVTGSSTVNVNIPYSIAGTTEVQSGFLNLLGGNASTGALVQTNGSISGSGTFTVSGPSTLNFGDHRGTGTTVLQGATTISSSGFRLDGGRTINNQNTLTWTAGQILFNNTFNGSSGGAGSGTINNQAGATFIASGGGASTMSASNFGGTDTGADAVFNNAGTFRKAGNAASDTTTVDVRFNNTGAIQVQTGVLSLSNGGTQGGSIDVSAGAVLRLSGGTHTFNTGTTNVAGSLELTTGILNVATAHTIGGTGTFSQSSGSVQGGNLTIASTANFTFGDHQGAGTTTLQGASTISVSGLRLDGGRVLRNEGTLTWTGGAILLNNNVAGVSVAGSATINNQAGANFIVSGANSNTISSSNFGAADNGADATFNNAGTFRKAGSLASSTTTVGVLFNNSGTINADTGVLSFSQGVQGTTGTIAIADNAVVTLGANSTTGRLLIAPGTAQNLNLGAQTLTVFTDYDNANFGSGNSFNRRNNVGVTGPVTPRLLAGGDVNQGLTGTGVGNGNTAAPTLVLGNVHVGTTTYTYNIANTGTTGPALRGAIQTGVNGGSITDARLSGNGVTAGNWGPVGAGNALSRDVVLTVNTAGVYAPVSGQTVNILNNFENTRSQLLTISSAAGAAAYNLAAAATVAPNPVQLGNQRVGGNAVGLLTIANTAPAGAFTEGLNASFGSLTGAAQTNGGSVSLLAGGASNSASMGVRLDGSTSGAKTGTVQINFASDGTGSSGLGLTALASQTVTVNGNFYNVAQGTATPSPVVLFNQRVGGAAGAVLTVNNTAAAGSFSEDLRASFGANTGAATNNGATINALLAGGSNSSTMVVGVDTTSAGAKTGSVTLNYQSTGTVGGAAIAGLSAIAANGPQVINVSGNVYQVAQASVPTSVSLGNFRLGGAAPGQAVTIGNTLVAPAGFQEGLDAAVQSVSGKASASGSIGNLAAGGSSQAISVGLTGATAGANNGSVVLNLASNGQGTSGLGVLGLGTATINVSGTGYNAAVGNSTTTPVVLTNQRVGGSGSAALTINNTAAAGSFSEDLRASFGANTGAATNNGASINALLAGGSNSSSLAVGVDTTTSGGKTGSVTINYQTTGTVGGTAIAGLGLAAANGPQVINVSGNVYQAAAGNLVNNTLNFGTVQVGQTVQTTLQVQNTATGAAGFVEDLNARFGSTSGTGAGLISGSGQLTGIAAGNTSTAANGTMTVSVNTGAAATVNGAIGVNYFSAGAVGGVTNGLGELAVGSQNFGVQGQINAVANVIDQARPVTNGVANLGAVSVDLGAVRVGGTLGSSLSVLNQATGNQQAALNASIVGNGAPVTASGSFNLLAPGATNSSSLQVGLNTASAGAKTGTATISYVSDANNVGNCAPNCQLSIGTQTVSVNGKVYAPAVGQLDTTSVNFGIVRVGDVVAARTIEVSNTAATAGLNDTLRANLSGVGGAFGGATTVGGVVAGAKGGMAVTLNTGAAGVFSQAGTVSFLSQNPDMADASAGASQPVQVNAQVNNLADARFNKVGGQGNLTLVGNTFVLDFGTLTLGAAVSSLVDILNLGTGPTDDLDASFDLSQALGLSLTGWNAIDDLQAGSDSADMQLDLVAGSLGLFERRIRLDGFSVNADDPSGLSLVRNLIIRANVIDPGQPVPEPGIFMLLVAAAAASFTASRMRRRVRPGL